MLSIRILGPGCTNCNRLESAVREVVGAKGLAARIEKVTNYAEIMRYPILHTPGLVINGKLVASGQVPSAEEIAQLIDAAGA